MKKETVDIEKIHELIFSFAEGDFTKRGSISSERGVTDSIIAGVNMLGEELESTTVSRDYLLSIYNSASDLMFVVDNNGIIIDLNNSVVNRLNVDRTDLIGEKVGNIFHGNEKGAIGDLIKRIRGDQKSISFNSSLSFNCISFPIRGSISRVFGRHIKDVRYLITVTDISLEKKQEQEILTTIISTEEKERTRLAYDLHDSLGQELNAIRMYFDVATRFKNDRVKFNSIVSDCKGLIDKSIQSVRTIAKDLMPKELEDGKLFCATKELSSSFAKLIKIRLRFPETEYALSIDKKVNIYRIVQEFITNTLKHSEGTEVIIDTKSDDSSYFFTISDNGCGFVDSDSTKGNGLKNMETRLKALKAEYSFTSKINEGTELKFKLPR